ncbi:Histone deacetylase HDT2 [Hibiscus syriacus]|uniref:Histone deacetylase HDT2 n=1 Tax=Hibiscus syriacus TaxID=106335 RepID=A0A6A2WM16_HIBSY|nr:Histone deacetylase HDT2 [Hibiscus syriacus]
MTRLSCLITGRMVASISLDTESEEELPQPTINLTIPHATTSDPTASQQVKIAEPKKDEDSSDDEDEDDSSAEDEEYSEDQAPFAMLMQCQKHLLEPAMPINGEKESDNDTSSDEDDSEAESSDEDQETPEKAGPSKKRSAESAWNTPAPEKKAKVVTPQKTALQVLGVDGKKVGEHTATPHLSKQAKKAAAAQAKQTPKSDGSSFPCKSSGRSFGSENALQPHSKAKHGGVLMQCKK